MPVMGQRVRRRRRLPLDVASVLLVPAGLVLIVLSQAASGVALRSLLQWPAALIVLGGTTAAIMLTYPSRETLVACRAAAGTFRVTPDDVDALAATLLALSIRAHRRGTLVLEAEAGDVADPFLREGIQLAVDGESVDTLRELLAVESSARAESEEAPARVFEAAAGYAPTLGILGAVLGLVDVMQHLAEPGALGPGIATAFVATVYGVGLANLVLLPLAGRLRERAALAGRRREMVTHAVCAIALRTNPRIVAQKLRSFSTRMPRIEEIARRTAGRPASRPAA
jgi:chemotaxis protein MotA